MIGFAPFLKSMSRGWLPLLIVGAEGRFSHREMSHLRQRQTPRTGDQTELETV